jgi:hypothetical protein
MTSSKRLGAVAIALPILALVFGGIDTSILRWLEHWSWETYCSGTPSGECFDAQGNSTMPGWVDTANSALVFTPFVLAVLLGLAGVVVGVMAIRRGKEPGGGRGLGIAGTIVSLIVFLPAAFWGGLFALFAMSGGGPHGRPLRISGRAIAGRARRRRTPWSDGVHPELEGTSPELRRALAAEWLEDARMEHSAIAAFARLATDLIAVGAPPELIEASARAAADEVRHARACFALASAYAGEPLGPDAMPEARSAPPRTERALLRELLHDSVVDGCIGERAAAITAERCAIEASDPAIRDVLATIAREESEHASLADAIVAWTRTELGGEADAIIAGAIEEAAEAPLATASDLDLMSHGRPSRALLATARRDAIARVAARERVACAA